MEKNTVIAIVLAGAILFAGTFITQMLNEKYAPPVSETSNDPESDDIRPISDGVAETAADDSSAAVSGTAGDSSGSVNKIDFPKQDYPIRTIVEETDLFTIEFSTAGGVAKEILLKKELDDGKPISMVLDGESGVGTFNIAFGGHDSSYLTDAFDFERTTKGKEKDSSFFTELFERRTGFHSFEDLQDYSRRVHDRTQSNLGNSRRKSRSSSGRK